MGYTLTLSKALQKTHLSVFAGAGYGLSPAYTKSGVFYVQKKGIAATGVFGMRRLQVRCSSKKICDSLVQELETLLVKVLHG